MKISGFYDESISNGLGWRAVLFVSGCPHNCKGCHNPDAQKFECGEKFEKEKIIKQINSNSILKGVTISGGEPLCKENIEEVVDFIKEVKTNKKNIWCYTGYTLEELENRDDSSTKEALKLIDVLVDGKFVEELKNPLLKFKGSENQRIIDLNEYRNQNKIVEVV